MLTKTALQGDATGFAFFSEPFAEVGARMSERERLSASLLLLGFPCFFSVSAILVKLAHSHAHSHALSLNYTAGRGTDRLPLYQHHDSPCIFCRVVPGALDKSYRSIHRHSDARTHPHIHAHKHTNARTRAHTHTHEHTTHNSPHHTTRTHTHERTCTHADRWLL